ncbi:MAG TPA: GNAT family N-acetyltransferase [Rhizomicrobium sp.]|jgi:RimJ/RimL family protein N-acetyltransferase
MERRYETAYGTLTLRAETPGDEPYLFALFKSHTERPLKQAGLPDAAIDTMVGFQYRAQTSTHRSMFPNAVFWIIEQDGVPMGRIIEDDEGDAIYWVDFVIDPKLQAKGLGTAFIIAMADGWAAQGKGVRVEVQPQNFHSLKLCAKSGMTKYADLPSGYIGLRRGVPK